MNILFVASREPEQQCKATKGQSYLVKQNDMRRDSQTRLWKIANGHVLIPIY